MCCIYEVFGGCGLVGFGVVMIFLVFVRFECFLGLWFCVVCGGCFGYGVGVFYFVCVCGELC